MNIDKFLKSIPPVANRIKEFFESMEPLPQVLTALGVILILMGAFFGPPISFFGGMLVGGTVSYHFFRDMTIEEKKAFPKKVFDKGKTYIVSLDIPTKLKDAGIRMRRFPEGGPTKLLPFVMIPAVLFIMIGLVMVVIYEPANNASNAMHQIEQCVEEKDSILLKDKYILKATCGTTYQEELPNGTLTGGADYDLAGDHVVFSGHVNTTSVHIVTEFTILVEYEGGTDTKTFHNVWIEPNNKHKFRFNPSEINSKPSKEDVNTNDFVWKIREVKGVPIVE